MLTFLSIVVICGSILLIFMNTRLLISFFRDFVRYRDWSDFWYSVGFIFMIACWICTGGIHLYLILTS